MNPRFPVYIPSKSRAEIALTPKALDRIGVPYLLVVEEAQAADYARVWGAEKILVLDPRYQEEYETCDDAGGTRSRGPGPARNFAWEHSRAAGARFHWVIDDNIVAFYHLNRNRKLVSGDGSGFHAMEEFALQYSNIGMVGPEYQQMVPARSKRPPFVINHRIYSCMLIRNDLPMRWECRYNEDTDLCLRMMKSGWLTVLFYAFLQHKMTTQTMPGGNTEAFYDMEGTLQKSQMLVARHPDVAEVKWRFRRWHHLVNYRPFQSMRLLRDPGYEPSGVTYRLVEKPQTEKLYSGVDLVSDKGYSRGRQ